MQTKEHKSSFKYANMLYKRGEYEKAHTAYDAIKTSNKILKQQASWWSRKSLSMINGSITNKHLEEIANCLMGPILLSYLQSLRKSIIEENIKQVNFLSREGFFLKQIYDNLMRDGLVPKIKTTYLLSSRSFLFKLLSSNEQSQHLTLAHPFTGTIGDLLRKRYLLSDAEVNDLIHGEKFPLDKQLNLPRDKEQTLEVLRNLSTKLKRLTKNELMHYLNYTNSVFGTDEEVHIADIGYSGTIQKSLSILTKKKITGHYFYTTRSAENDAQNRYIGHLSYGINFGEGFSLVDRSILQEMLLTGPNGQLQGIEFTATGYQFKFGPKGVAQDNFETLKQIFTHTEDYIRINLTRNATITSDVLNIYHEEYINSQCFLQNPIQHLLEIDDTISGTQKIIAKKVLSHA